MNPVLIIPIVSVSLFFVFLSIAAFKDKKAFLGPLFIFLGMLTILILLNCLDIISNRSLAISSAITMFASLVESVFFLQRNSKKRQE